MSRQQQRRRNDRQKTKNGEASPNDVWRTPAPMPELEPIRPNHDPTALVRSLGDPPVHPGLQAGYRFGAVIEKTSNLATIVLTQFAPDLLDGESERG